MSTPIWGSTPGQDDDRTPGSDPYAAPAAGADEGADQRFGTGWGGTSGYPQAPAPSGYEAKPSWQPSSPTSSASGGPGSTGAPSPYGPAATVGGAPAADPYGAPSTTASGSTPYGAPPYGSTPYGSTPYGAPPATPYGSAPPATPYGAPPGQQPYGAVPPAPGYPAGGYPGSGYPAAPPAYPGPWGRPPRTEPLATASLVTSLASFLVTIAAPVGLGLGIAALRRIRRTGDQGRGMAIAGVVIGGLLTAFIAVMLVFAIAIPLSINAQRSSEGSTTTTETEAPQDDPVVQDDGTWLPWYELTIALAPGQCIADVPWEYDMSDAQLVDCATSHDTEVLSSIALTGPVSEDLTVADPVYDQAIAECDAQAAALLGQPVEDIGFVDVFYPHPDQWDAGGQSGICVLVTADWVSGSAIAGTLVLGVSTDV